MEQPAYTCLVEPDAYAELFRKFPPLTFSCSGLERETPSFVTPLDLLMVMDESAVSLIKKIPFFSSLRKIAVLKTHFVGATITEYCPLASPLDESAFFRRLIENQEKSSLLLIKDLPYNSPLLDEQTNAFVDSFVRNAAKHGFFQVEGENLAYLPIDFPNTDAWLAGFSYSHRKNLRRKFRSRTKVDIEYIPLGDERFNDDALLDEMYAMFMEVYEQSQVHFDCLSLDFFKALFRTTDFKGVCVQYRRKDNGRLVCWNVSLIHNNMLVDKFIGFRYPDARELDLYFVSWLVNVEYCLMHGLTCYVAGWTDSKVKASLGAHFTKTRHLARLANPVLQAMCKPLRHFFESEASSKQ